MALRIRIPGWAQNQVLPSDLYSFSDNVSSNYSVKINGKSIESQLEKGYFVIDRTWKKGDKIEVHFNLEPRVITANEKVEADKGRISFERGPIVYCAEWPDNDFEISSVLIPANPEVQVIDNPELLNGIKQFKNQRPIVIY